MPAGRGIVSPPAVHRSEIPTSALFESACPVCRGERRRPLFEENGFSVWRCAACDHAFVSPRPSDEWLRGYYERTYHRGEDDEKEWEGPLGDVYDAVARAVAIAVPRRGDLLDVGCGFGGFLDRARRDGWRAIGIEPNGASATVARRRLGESARIEALGWGEAKLAEGSLDCIVMLNVIEHVPDPVAVVERAYRLLRPGGCLALRWPQIVFVRRWMARIGMEPIALGAPAHLHDFTRRSMRGLLERAGFRDVRHTWGGMRRFDRVPLRERIAIRLMRLAARSPILGTDGRFGVPWGAVLSLGIR